MTDTAVVAADTPTIEVLATRITYRGRVVLVTRVEVTESGVRNDRWVVTSNGEDIASFDNYKQAESGTTDFLLAASQADELRAQADSMENDAKQTVATLAAPAKAVPEPLPVPPVLPAETAP